MLLNCLTLYAFISKGEAAKVHEKTSSLTPCLKKTQIVSKFFLHVEENLLFEVVKPRSLLLAHVENIVEEVVV